MALAPKQKRKPPVAHKRRVGQHHKQSKRYLKSYWPYLPMLLIVVGGMLVNNVWSTRGVLGAASDYSASTFLDVTNTDRAHAHKAALTLDPELTIAAQNKANDLAAHNYWSHTSPDGKTPWDFIAASGYQYQMAGENLAYGFSDASSTEAGWMNSVDHRANILNSSYSQVGFATVTSHNYLGKGPQTIVVAEYASPAPAAANITFSVPNPDAHAAVKTATPPAATQELPAQNVARIQLLTNGHATWSLFAVSAIASSALIIFLLRHGFYLRRAMTRGEMFIAHHPLFDIVILVIAVTGFVLTRVSGFIR